MLITQTREIQGTVYKVTQLGAKKGRSVLLCLFRGIGPAAAAGSAGDIEKALACVAENLNEADLEKVCDMFAESTKIQAEAKLAGGETKEIGFDLKAQFDGHFAGRYLAMIEWLAFCIEVNYSDFFEGKKTERRDK